MILINISLKLINRPKSDQRFDNKPPMGQGLSPSEFTSLAQSEANLDDLHARQLTFENAAFSQLSSDLVQRATNVLLPYICDDRKLRIESVLQKRTSHCRFLFENPSNPSNVWAW